ncbi:MAG: hypothetical protein H6686_03675 [Fibrobacteria bacterium]|nr:hypothetical protein [Fibrobacteria bacterium]
MGKVRIEILPKAEPARREGVLDRVRLARKWRWILLRMVSALPSIELDLDQIAGIATQDHSILEVFYGCFLKEVREIHREGLLRTYRMVRKDRTALRGRLVLGEDLRRNLVHRERVHTEAMEFDLVNSWNRVLVEGLRVVDRRTRNSNSRAQAKSFLVDRECWPRWTGAASAIPRLAYDRRTERYRNTMRFAELVLLSEYPDLSSGTNDVTALLFDMNALWEAWVLKCLQREVAGTGWTLQDQVKLEYWRAHNVRRSLRPDIWLKPPTKHDSTGLTLFGGKLHLTGPTILDTKWKVLQSPAPSDDDLRQLLAYSLRFDCPRGWLVYPQAHGLANTMGQFQEMNPIECGLAFVDLPNFTEGA